MIETKRIFLFGAGAVLEWGAPSTTDLNNLVLESGFKICDNETTITRFIYQTLIEHKYPEKDINFETIISVIEEMLVYYSNSGLIYKLDSFHKCFYEPKFADEIMNFSVKDVSRSVNHTLEIPKGVEYTMNRIHTQNETPEQIFLEYLLNSILSNICARIIEYSCYSIHYSNVNFGGDFSKSLVEWLSLHAKQTSLRLYTLNYDRVFKILLEKSGIKIFEGFDFEKPPDSHDRIRPNVKKILTDMDGNVYYNLHGCFQWDVEELDIHKFAHAEVLYSNFPNLQINNTPASVQIEKGKTLMITNVVTGYQKAQKAMITPFKQMQASFDKDCCFTEEIYIIGYSFGDEHINSSIRTALRHNSKLKVIIVDPYFMQSGMDFQVWTKLFTANGKSMRFPKKIDEGVYSYNEETFIAYSMTFEKFRLRQLNTFNKAAGGILFP